MFFVEMCPLVRQSAFVARRRNNEVRVFKLAFPKPLFWSAEQIAYVGRLIDYSKVRADFPVFLIVVP